MAALINAKEKHKQERKKMENGREMRRSGEEAGKRREGTTAQRQKGALFVSL